jgi:hypothetical protein
MFRTIILFALLFDIIRTNLIFEDVNFVIENANTNGVYSKNIDTNRIFPNNVEFKNILFQESLGTTFEPTLEPTFEPSLEPTFEPTFDHIMGPTSGPSSYEDNDIINKILEFNIQIELVNVTKNVLNDEDKTIIILTFQEVSEIDKKYITFLNKNFRYRKLDITSLNLQFYNIQETILFSIPLINKYKIYESDPILLYNSLKNIINDSLESDLFINLLKEYAHYFNNTLFDYIEINLLEISEPNIIYVSNNEEPDNKISGYEITIIVCFSFTGLCIFIYILKRPRKRENPLHFLNKKIHSNENIYESIENKVKMTNNDFISSEKDFNEKSLIEIEEEEKTNL